MGAQTSVPEKVNSPVVNQVGQVGQVGEGGQFAAPNVLVGPNIPSIRDVVQHTSAPNSPCDPAYNQATVDITVHSDDDVLWTMLRQWINPDYVAAYSISNLFQTVRNRAKGHSVRVLTLVPSNKAEFRMGESIIHNGSRPEDTRMIEQFKGLASVFAEGVGKLRIEGGPFPRDFLQSISNQIGVPVEQESGMWNPVVVVQPQPRDAMQAKVIK